MILTKVKIENYISKEELYSKQIRGGLSFVIKTHQLNKGKKIQLILCRDYNRMEELLERNKEHNFLSSFCSQIKTTNDQIKLFINDKDFMLETKGGADITIQEYNMKQNYVDFPKGKVYISIDIDCMSEMDNSKVLLELKKYNNEGEKNEG